MQAAALRGKWTRGLEDGEDKDDGDIEDHENEGPGDDEDIEELKNFLLPTCPHRPLVLRPHGPQCPHRPCPHRLLVLLSFCPLVLAALPLTVAPKLYP